MPLKVSEVRMDKALAKHKDAEGTEVHTWLLF